MLDINPLTFFTSCQLVPTEHVREFVAVQTRGDGNSCFRAASFLLFGTNVSHLELRLRTVCELALHSLFYSADGELICRMETEMAILNGKSTPG